jgi:hypothetical protein
MTTIQKKNVKGNKYWYIVESRRVNGKPRPVVLAYLGKADDLLKRLLGNVLYKLKSFSHDDIGIFLYSLILPSPSGLLVLNMSEI